MKWSKVGRFWGYGDTYPILVAFVDSLCGLRSSRGRVDAAPLIWHCLCDATAASVMVVAYPGARATDYAEMARACAYMQAARLLLISMGNDLLRAPVNVDAIATHLLQAGAVFPRTDYVFGGSAKLWGYSDDAYDRHVADVCSIVGGINGAVELSGIRTADRTGHLRPICSGIHCRAFATWASPSRQSKL